MAKEKNYFTKGHGGKKCAYCGMDAFSCKHKKNKCCQNCTHGQNNY